MYILITYNDTFCHVFLTLRYFRLRNFSDVKHTHQLPIVGYHLIIPYVQYQHPSYCQPPVCIYVLVFIRNMLIGPINQCRTPSLTMLSRLSAICIYMYI